jgi:hypothetical protein
VTLGASGPYRVQPKWGPTARAGLSASRSPIRSADRRWVPCGDVFELMNRLKAGPVRCSAVDGRAGQCVWIQLCCGALCFQSR